MARVQRGDLAAMVLPDQISETLLRGAAEQSLILKYGTTVPMSAKNKVFREAEVSGANAFWVGEGQRKTTDAPTMTQKQWTMTYGELAVIVPLDEDVQDDATVDLFELYKPNIESAIARKLDSAALWGVDKPVAWGTLGTDIVPLATTAAMQFVEDGNPTDAELLDLIAGTGASTPDGALQALEFDGYAPNLAIARLQFKSRLRNLKDSDGRYIFGDATSPNQPGTLFGVPIEFKPYTTSANDTWVAAEAHMIMGDFSKAYVGTRKGIRYKVFDQGVITDGAGNVVYSLMESDMIALRVTAHFGFKVIADETADTETWDSNSLSPFALVAPAQ